MGVETTFFVFGLLITLSFSSFFSFSFSFSLSRSFIFSETNLRPSLLLANKPFDFPAVDCGIDGLPAVPSFADRSRVTLAPGPTAADLESGLDVDGVGAFDGGIVHIETEDYKCCISSFEC